MNWSVQNVSSLVVIGTGGDAVEGSADTGTDTNTLPSTCVGGPACEGGVCGVCEV